MKKLKKIENPNEIIECIPRFTYIYVAQNMLAIFNVLNYLLYFLS